MKINNLDEVFAYLDNHPDLPRAREGEDMEILYADDWYDGELSGMCVWHNQRLFYVIDEKTMFTPDRRYALLMLTEEQQKEEDYLHKLFVENRMYHFDVFDAEYSKETRGDIMMEQVIGWLLLYNGPAFIPAKTENKGAKTNMRIYADFNGREIDGKIRLSTAGSLADIKKYNDLLRPGLTVTLYDEELELECTLEYDAKGHCWKGVPIVPYASGESPYR